MDLALTLKRTARTLLLAAVAVGLGGAFCGQPPPAPEDAGEPEDCFENSIGGCVISSPDCDPSAISNLDGQTCATCDNGGDAIAICGEASVARCYPLEGPNGDCTVCDLDSGERIFSDCFQGQEVGDDLTCTDLTREQQGGEPLTCEICRDETGRIVSELCRPEEFDSCEEQPADDSGCVDCVNLDGELVFRTCEPVEVPPPRLCQVYESEVGRCVDCFGADDELILHQCSVGDEVENPTICETFVFEDERCEVCTDDAGNRSEVCEPINTSEAFRCERLVSAYEDCVVCVNDAGRELRTTCEPICEANDCGECFSVEDVSGASCRECVGADGDQSRVCFQGGDVQCAIFDNVDAAGDPDPNDPNAAPPVTTCTICEADGQPLFESCEGVSEPVCSPTQDPLDNLPCDRCRDPLTGATFTTCENEPAGICEDTSILLRGANLEILTVPSSGGDIDAEVDCSVCPGAFGTCETRSTCVEDADTCPVPVAFVFKEADVCDPWGRASTDEAIGEMMRLLMVELDSSVFFARVELGAECGDQDCGCNYGSIELLVPQSEAPRFVNSFGFSF